MAEKKGNSKKARKPKTSAGLNRGAKKQRPPELLLIAMNKGMMHQTRQRR